MTIEQIATLVVLVLILGFSVWAYKEAASSKKD